MSTTQDGAEIERKKVKGKSEEKKSKRDSMLKKK
jgi:hypothetical protein